MKKSFFCFTVLSIVCLTTYTYATILLPTADGHYYYDEYCYTVPFGYCVCPHTTHLGDGIYVSYSEGPWICGPLYCVCPEYFYEHRGIVEFDISIFDGLFISGHIEAQLYLTVKDENLSNDQCLGLYNIHDANENGVIEEVDSDTGDCIKVICKDFQQGDVIIFDVKTAIEHDLFAPDQTSFSGFVLRGDRTFIEFYDHTNPQLGPRLSVVDTDADRDDVLSIDDNCPDTYNPGQEDTYPPGGNGIGDACECEGDFDCDRDQDGSDAAKFKQDFGRSSFEDPCTEENTCNGNFDADQDVDGMDAAKFKEDFGRSIYNDICPPCAVAP